MNNNSMHIKKDEKNKGYNKKFKPQKWKTNKLSHIKSH